MHYAPAKKQWLVGSFQKSLAKQQLVLRKAITPNEMRKMALYKLALTLAKHKMPFSACEAFITFNKAADPDSIVFKNLLLGAETQLLPKQENILRPELTEKITNSPYWSLMADDSTDSAVQEQCGVYARFIDLEHQTISTRFLSFWWLVGHPDTENVYQGILHVIDESGLKLPLKKLVGFTCDGATEITI